jgi:hypothetical protein
MGYVWAIRHGVESAEVQLSTMDRKMGTGLKMNRDWTVRRMDWDWKASVSGVSERSMVNGRPDDGQ